MKKKLLLCMVVLIVLVQLQSSFVHAQGTGTKQTVRVVFFAFDGYHMIDEDGQKSGYGYEKGFSYEPVYYDSVDQLKDAYDAGMNWHIAKPIRVEELMAALAEILKEEKIDQYGRG